MLIWEFFLLTPKVFGGKNLPYDKILNYQHLKSHKVHITFNSQQYIQLNWGLKLTETQALNNSY